MSVLELLVVILVVMWLSGVGLHVGGSEIHLLLVVVVVIVIVQLLQRGRT